MRKQFSIILFVLFLSFFIVGCNSKEDAEENDPNKIYHYKFLVNEEVVKEGEGLSGTLIEYPKRPTPINTAEFFYSFDGWDNDAIELTNKDEIFNATWEITRNEYTIKFIGDGDEELSKQKIGYGTNPTVPSVADKQINNLYTIHFAGWDKEVSTVTKDETYHATYTATKKTVTTLEGLKVSFLGDSITTFYEDGSQYNNLYPDTSTTKINFYPSNSPDVKKWDQTWWGQLISNTNMDLGINNSWSGSFAYDYSGQDERSCAMSTKRVETLDDNGKPDIVIVFIGTNDICSKYPERYGREEYTKALETIVERIHTYCSTYTDIFFVHMYLSTAASMYSERIKMYNEVIDSISAKYNCGIIQYDEYMKQVSNQTSVLPDWTHPNLLGSTILANASEKAIKEYYGLTYNGTVIPK